MRKDVKKYLFIGLEKEIGAFFAQAQEEGIIHFVDSKGIYPKELPESLEKYIQGIKILRTLTPVEQVEAEDLEAADAIVTDILKLSDAIATGKEEVKRLNSEISLTEPFGNFSLEDLAEVEKETGKKFQFFYTKQDADLDFLQKDSVIWITAGNGLDYYTHFAEEPVRSERIVEVPIKTPLNKLLAKRDEVNKHIHASEVRLSKLQKYHDFLVRALVEKYDQHTLHATENMAMRELNGKMFAIEGWAPEDKITILKELTAKLHVNFEEIAAEPEEMAPTYLENKGIARAGEDLVHIYDTPSNKDKDPSLWVLGAFSLFFAMIIGDGGYGIIFLALTAYLYYKLPKKNSTKRVLTLLAILSIACIAWGFLTNAFFGIEVSPNNPLRKFSILNWLDEKYVGYHIALQDKEYQDWVSKYPETKGITDPHEFLNKAVKIQHGKEYHELVENISRTILFELSLFVGIIHIIISILRYLDRNWGGVGWIIFLIGAYLYFPTMLGTITLANFVFGISPETAASQGLIMIGAGLVLAFILSIVSHGLTGAMEIMHVIQLFADVLSYLRLYALGLAGAIVAATINEFTAAMPFAFAIVVLILGHTLNMVIGVMSGIIHGLRLNFLESYHYSFEGGGKLFNPLRLRSKE